MRVRKASVPYVPEIVVEFHPAEHPAEPYRVEVVNEENGTRLALTARQWMGLTACVHTIRAVAR